MVDASTDIPTLFLPILPRQSLNTLYPLTPDVISSHIDHLSRLLIPGIHGTSDAVATSSGSSSNTASSSTTTRDEPPATTPTTTTLDEFERDWAEKWLHGLITCGEGWLAEIEPDDYDQDDDNDEPEVSEKDTAEDEHREDDEAWREYEAREKVLKDASALISSLAGCAGECKRVRRRLAS
jgi:hypothetical protein